ncbi:hypothetical protein [Paenibacillus massiliensis]|uniref:hypothetical protein n=1 Tax=Paenibacillus massiliensis TaxID=225917 RepID=UPI00047002A4|nr:hypothetical protein [Paenibacillus massiliensis]
MATFAEALALKTRLAPRLLKNVLVQAVGVGYADPTRPSKGAAVIIYTHKGVSYSSLGMSLGPTVLKQEKSGHAVRVVQAARLNAHVCYRSRIRPVPAGYSVGTVDGSGTAGLIVVPVADKEHRYLLSNNHVLTDPVNSRRCVATIQPGGADGGRSRRDQIGRLYRIIRLKRRAKNYMDAALSKPFCSKLLDPRYATVGTLPGYVTSYRVGDRLVKVGRTTGRVSGRVDSVHTDVQVSYGEGLGTITFQDQTIIAGKCAVSLPGDSGSVWLTCRDHYAAAVNYAGTDDGKLSIAYPVSWFMRAFRMQVARPAGKGAARVKCIHTKGNPAYARQLSQKEIQGLCMTRPFKL